MNKHGQTLILFVILIPIIILLMATLVDVGLIVGKKVQLKEVTKSIIKETYYLDDDKIKDLYKKNNIDISNLKILRESDKLEIEIRIEVKSIFGGIVGIKKYDVKVNMIGYLKNNKIIIE